MHMMDRLEWAPEPLVATVKIGPFAAYLWTVCHAWTIRTKPIDCLPKLLQIKTKDSTHRTKNLHEQVMIWTKYGPRGPSVPTKQTVRQVRTKQARAQVSQSQHLLPFTRSIELTKGNLPNHMGK
jgi:hypothetical protein